MVYYLSASRFDDMIESDNEMRHFFQGVHFDFLVFQENTLLRVMAFNNHS